MANMEAGRMLMIKRGIFKRIITNSEEASEGTEVQTLRL